MTTTTNTYKGFAGCPEELIDKVRNIENISNNIQDKIYHWSADGNSLSYFCNNVSHCLMRYIGRKQDIIHNSARYTTLVEKICKVLPVVQILADYTPGYYDEHRSVERENKQFSLISNFNETINDLDELFELMK